MADKDNKLKHLDFIQLAITRMAANSFLLKGWAVSLVAAIFALAAKDANQAFIAVAYFPAIIFWLMDSYYLQQEKLFRELYKDVSKRKTSDIDFLMNPQDYNDQTMSWTRTMFTKTVGGFYISILIIILFVMLLMSHNG